MLLLPAEWRNEGMGLGQNYHVGMSFVGGGAFCSVLQLFVVVVVVVVVVVDVVVVVVFTL